MGLLQTTFGEVEWIWALETCQVAVTGKLRILTHFFKQNSAFEKINVDRGPSGNQEITPGKGKLEPSLSAVPLVLGALVPSGALSPAFSIILASVFLTLTPLLPKISSGQAVHSVGGIV